MWKRWRLLFKRRKGRKPTASSPRTKPDSWIVRNRPSEVGLEDFPNDDEYSIIAESDSEYDLSEEENEEIRTKLSRYDKMKMIFSYPFFISTCLSYFTVQLIKTLFSDWSQMYLIKSLHLNSYTGLNLKHNLKKKKKL